MKILVASDNHGEDTVLEDLINIYEDIDLWLHCGDSEFSENHPVWKTYQTVRGNMDFEITFPEIVTDQLGDTTVMVLHGHKHRVKYTLDLMEEAATENKAEIVFYGHSHVAKVDKQNNIYFINPGSISQPRGDLNIGSYAIYEKAGEEASITFYDWNHNELNELSKKLI